MSQLKDIASRTDIIKIVNEQYRLMMQDDELAHIFKDRVGQSMLEHLDTQYDFWESVIFSAGKYDSKRIVPQHLQLHSDHTLNATLFERWLEYFNKSVDDSFVGPIAEVTKDKACTIAAYIHTQIINMERERLELNN